MNKKYFFPVLLLIIVLFYSSAQGKEDPKVFSNYILQYGQDPVEYIKDKMKSHYVVALGEDHWIKDHAVFMRDLIYALAQDTTVNLDILAWEFGNSANQKIADEFTNSPVYREDLAIKILQNSPDTYGWPYLEYIDVLKAVWETNQINPDKKTRVVLLDPKYMIPYMDKEEFTYTTTRDITMMEIIQRSMREGKRIIFFAGLGHTSYRLTGTYMSDKSFYWNQHSAGKLLKTLYPSLVFSIKLWGGRMGSKGYMPADDDYKWERLFDGSIDEAFRLNGNNPVAFDMGGPFSKITVADFFHTSPETLARAEDPFSGSPYTKEEMLGEQIDGIVFFKPIEEFSGSTVYEPFFDDEFLERIEKRTRGKITSRLQIYEDIKEDHPIVSESLDKLIEKEIGNND